MMIYHSNSNYLMDAQFNFQLRSAKDKKDWDQITAYYKTYCDRTTALRYARKLSRIFKSEIRMTEGADPFKTSGTYINENNG
ncbi:addiction module toxin RelE [Chryseobacterium indologenes]|uniref:addiction module toxin RelE n=1 Tax=Chryseobacterium TaxID=59732 RepID=UPI001E5E9BA4|nr:MULTISPECIES: addiction module toxin RelE [Chryseobacterium]MEB4760232.1 addiction module toxin RelE [Chryseobacterium indologenes]UMQ40551.1 addiction module toxin RelE [Chryseobacterium sp. Y16C]